MRSISRLVFSLVFGLAFLSSGFTCGPGYISPVFDTTSAPETPFTDFASGRLGIIKPEYHRGVLYAAYRWIAGNGMSQAEQNAAIEVWRADFDNKDFRDDSVDEAVKAWVAKRAEVMGKDDKTPAIYTERDYGGYDFFPNCTKNAFEVAAETLSDRVSAHGPSDAGVRLWVKGQDDVFENCSQGKQTPTDIPQGSPEWLEKDHAYQKAAAEFYSLDYDAAKKDFTEIAQDPSSPWSETADYMVARTLIRQASLSKSNEKTAALYSEVEVLLERILSRGGKFADSANRLMGLVKYRNHPQQRVTELAKNLTIYAGGNENFRQDLIDYTWLLDKFESEILTAEEKRKEALKPKDANIAANTTAETDTIPTTLANTGKTAGGKKNETDLEIYLYLDSATVTFYVPVDATDDQAIAAAEVAAGRTLTKEQKESVRSSRQTAYAARFSNGRDSGYEGSYYGEEKLTPSLLPDYLRQDDLTDWLYTYQGSGAEFYLRALEHYKQTGSELWLMTALAKADTSSKDLARIIAAGKDVSPTSPAFPTIAYHVARLLIASGKAPEAKKLVEDVIAMGDRLPQSTQNSFTALKLRFANGLDEYLTYSLKKPYAFDFDGSVGNVEDFIAEQKKWYNPEYNKDGREAYEKEIEDNYKTEKLWQGRAMFDTQTINTFNEMFSTSMLMQVEASPALPDYMRERFIAAIWMRSLLLNDKPTLVKVTPEFARLDPEWSEGLARISAAKTDIAFERAALYFVLKNPALSPYLEDGIGKADNEQGQWDYNDWWCTPYDDTDDAGNDIPKKTARPPFLTSAQVQAAEAERKRLKDIGDAPKFLAERVMAWAKAAPLDKRVPEALYIVIEANGWTKYGCGNDEEIHDSYAAYLKKHYPNSEWTAKLLKDEEEAK